jgi:hypothetical protein
MKLIGIFISTVLIAGCATESGNKRQAQHSADQIRMVAVQKEAQVDQAKAQAAANVALVEALARVAEANPEQAPSVSVALAVIGVSGGASAPGNSDRTVALQPLQDSEALRWAEALAPTVGGLVTGLGTAAINASVQKNASDNMRDVTINDDNKNAAIIQSVAGLGREALINAGDNYAGDYYSLSDDASVDNSVTTTTTNTTTTTSVADSYNTQSQDTIIDQGEDGFYVGGNYGIDSDDDFSSTNYDLTNTVTTTTTVTYGGTEMSLGDLISYLQGLGSPYSLSIGGEVVASSTSGTGSTTTIDCTIPQFSPQHPDCT